MAAGVLTPAATAALGVGSSLRASSAAAAASSSSSGRPSTSASSSAFFSTQLRSPAAATWRVRWKGRASSSSSRTRCEAAASATTAAAEAPAEKEEAAATRKQHSNSFMKVRTEEELLAAVDFEVASGRLPPQAKKGFQLFWDSYKRAVEGSGLPGSHERAVLTMATVADRILVQFEDPYTFPTFHHRMLEPYDYYLFGQNYVKNLINFDTSFVGHLDRADQIQEQLRDGHNVVLLANHQTEADPAVFALMLERTHPELAEGVIYVAGDRVVTDPFCKPFSMGRNLLCVYSKRHLDDVPELKPQKQAQNRKTLMRMAQLFNEGGHLVWIAPSGGRDRPNPQTDRFEPGAFDPSAVEMMRRLIADSAKPGHLYPMAMVSHAIMPPPRTIEAKIGEVRVCHYSGVGLSFGPELPSSPAAGASKKESQQAYADGARAAVVAEYDALEAAILGEGSVREGLVQPWKEG